MLGKHWCEGDGGCKDRVYCGRRSVVTEEVEALYHCDRQFSEVHLEAEMTHSMFKSQIFPSFEIKGGPE
jgi:hypothetical protein